MNLRQWQANPRKEIRFPDDFMFELTEGEVEILRSQNVISRSHGASRHGHLNFTLTPPPQTFTLDTSSIIR
jgi:hypothetical protein